MVQSLAARPALPHKRWATVTVRFGVTDSQRLRPVAGRVCADLCAACVVFSGVGTRALLTYVHCYSVLYAYVGYRALFVGNVGVSDALSDCRAFVGLSDVGRCRALSHRMFSVYLRTADVIVGPRPRVLVYARAARGALVRSQSPGATA